MAFVIEHDFDPYISTDDLNTILDNDDHILQEAIEGVKDEISAYIRHRYDLALALPDCREWNATDQFNVAEVVLLTAKKWVSQEYTVGAVVRYKPLNLVYRCILNTTSTQDPTDGTYWELLGEFDKLYTVEVQHINQRPNDTNYFTPRDKRNKLLVRLFIDLVLYDIHSRINPRNIPEFRVQRRDDAMKLLKDLSDPRKNVDLGLTKIDHGTDKGLDVGTFGKSDGAKHTY